MHTYSQSVMKQINVAVQSIVQLVHLLRPEDLEVRPTASKMSVGELLAHISILCQADFRIGSGASQEGMESFYTHSTPPLELKAIEMALLDSYDFLEQQVSLLDEDELLRQVTSYWGTIYTRFEWLLEIQSHLYHHRGQLHAIMVHELHLDPQIPLFE